METIQKADKDLFVKFRDGKMTMDQLKVRLAERAFDIQFKCLDDLKDRGAIDPKFYENVEAFVPFFNMIYGANANYLDVVRDL